MSSKRNGLGRNLSALLGDSNTQRLETANDPQLVNLEITKIQAGQYQPRRDFEDDALEELASSIKQQGLLQPIVVRALRPGAFEIIAGERRFRACKIAGLSSIPAMVRQVDNETAMAIALIENMQREDLNAAEQARGIARLIEEFQLTHQQVAHLLGKSRTAISNFMRLLNLSDTALRMLEIGDLDMGHARALLSLPQEQQEECAHSIVANGWSVRETELWVKRLLQPRETTPTSAPITLSSQLIEQSEKLAQRLETHVQVKHQKGGKGSLQIRFDDPIMLEKILTQLTQ